MEDYLLASFMDDDKNGFLTADEKKQASKVKEYFSKECINISAAGIKTNRDKLNQFRVIQKNGKVLATHN